MKLITKSFNLLIFFLIFVTSINSFGNLPNFSKIKDIKQKKEQFFNYLSPIISKVNNNIIEKREKIKKLFKTNELSKENKAWLKNIAEEFNIKDWNGSSKLKQKELLKRVDIVPSPLVLAQAANESAWGTSRFARHGNNIFGQWCFTKGCGMIPKERPNGRTYAVRKFASIKDSIKAYIYNLNTNHHYKYFRELRADLRAKNKPLNSIYLTQGLTNYSTRKGAYVSEIKQMIASNGLERKYNFRKYQ